MERGPCSRSYRCLPTDLESSSERICQPTLESGWENPLDNGKTGGKGGSGRPNMAISALVPKATDLSLLSSTPLRIHPQEDLLQETREKSLPQVNPPLVRMAYLRHHYSDRNLSTEASELLLSSWRQRPPSRMTHCVANGSAGVLNGRVIPLHDQDL